MVRCAFIIETLFCLWNAHHYKCDSLWGIGGSSAVICYEAISFHGLLCFNTNHVAASQWWAFVISCHDWIQMVFGCIPSWLWQPSEVLDDGGCQWNVTVSLSMTRKVTHSHHVCSARHRYGLLVSYARVGKHMSLELSEVWKHRHLQVDKKHLCGCMDPNFLTEWYCQNEDVYAH